MLSKILCHNLFIYYLSLPLVSSTISKCVFEFGDATKSLHGDGSLLEGIFLTYKIGKDMTSSQIKATILDDSCSNEIKSNSIIVSEKKLNEDPTSNEVNDAIISIYIEEKGVQDTIFWQGMSDNSGVIDFCVRTELLLSESSISIHFVETKLHLNVIYGAGFYIDDISMDVNNSREGGDEINFEVSACVCDETDYSCITKPLIEQNSPPFLICVQPLKNFIEIVEFTGLRFYQDGKNKYSPIVDGIANPLTQNTTGPGLGIISSYMIAPFFEGLIPSQVRIEGDVTLDFATSLNSLRGSLYVTKRDHAKFSIKIDLKSRVIHTESIKWVVEKPKDS